MKNSFDNPLAPKKKVSGKEPWSFKAPSYDNRTSGSISAGDNYGTAIRAPIGKEKVSSLSSGPLSTKSKCFSPNEIFSHEDVSG